MDRFYAKVNKSRGCWTWTAAVSKNGYGIFTLNGKKVYAHRAAWMIEVGPIPDGAVIDHECRTRHCVRVSHLRVTTQRVNILAGQGLAALNAKKTLCHKGHKFGATRNGKRTCPRCESDRKAIAYRTKLVDN